MDQLTSPISSPTVGKTDTAGTPEQKIIPSPYAGRPLDGSQYMDVIEEQEYADQRPSAEEQKPRYSYMKVKEQDKRDKK
jgi:hypothetical protein